jgi:hypothetical protein
MALLGADDKVAMLNHKTDDYLVSDVGVKGPPEWR